MVKKSGIYKIQSKIKSERIYIGSAVNITQRWYCHLSSLRLNKHANKKLQSHYNKYGECDLSFSILICCDKDDLIKHEQYFIDAYNPWFNNTLTAGSNMGLKWTEESKAKIRKPKTEQHIINMSIAKKGKKRHPHSLETKKAIGISNTGKRYKQKNKSDYHCKKIINTNTGQIFNSMMAAADSVNISRNALYILFSRDRNMKYDFQYYEG